MTPSARHLGLFAGLSLALVVRADPSLAARSPFLPPDQSGSAVATENTPLELRGIMGDTSGYKFSIYDPAKKSGQWVKLNEAGHDFTVKAHDVVRDTISLDYQGRMLTLPLHSAKVVSVAVSEPPPPSMATNEPRPIRMGGGGLGPQPKPSSPEEAARYNRAIEEISRRRAAREKSSQGPMVMPK